MFKGRNQNEWHPPSHFKFLFCTFWKSCWIFFWEQILNSSSLFRDIPLGNKWGARAPSGPLQVKAAEQTQSPAYVRGPFSEGQGRRRERKQSQFLPLQFTKSRVSASCTDPRLVYVSISFTILPARFPGLLLIGYLILGKFLHLSVPQFLHAWNGDNKCTHFLGLA